ncbi:hypothetical protein RFI_31891 [Reticulomyxa filosa]|uniref:Uncharacterized protein n=1 Tax=Reticulomyxa filosa TaxID=46433 RepID=X6LXP8_RETFI|nr:hypothetical protein RFI_31891 [Reticulomyxa filosa]|eukprot:ETO05505.1 hypothetical protein RFI_31891 [Reticulomyxa filosa]
MGLELLAHQFNHPFEIYTFGSPLVLEADVGDTTEIGKALAKRIKNFVYQFDIVPRIQRGWSKNANLLWICGRLKWNVTEIEQLCVNSFGPIGEYFLLFDYFVPPMVLKKKKTFVRCLEGRCIQLLKLDHLFELVPYYRGTNANQVMDDHSMLRYLSKLLFLDTLQLERSDRWNATRVVIANQKQALESSTSITTTTTTTTTTAAAITAADVSACAKDVSAVPVPVRPLIPPPVPPEILAKIKQRQEQIEKETSKDKDKDIDCKPSVSSQSLPPLPPPPPSLPSTNAISNSSGSQLVDQKTPSASRRNMTSLLSAIREVWSFFNKVLFTLLYI